MHIPRLIAFDLDGTLAESKQRVSAEMADLLTQLLAKMPVAIMSGASFAQFERQFFPSLPPEAKMERLYIFPTNAAECRVYRGGTWQLEYDRSFSDEEAGAVQEALIEALDVVGLSQPPAQTWGPRIENRSGGQVSFSPLGQQAPVDAKQEWSRAHNNVRKALRDELAKRLPSCTVSMGGMTTVDITPKDVDKAYGIKRLSELTHIPVEDMLYVGDALEEGGNDSVVIKTGIRTHAVFGPQETAALIQEMLGAIR